MARVKTEKFPRKAIPIYEGKSEEETQRNFAAMVTAAETAAYRVVMSAERKSGLGDPLDVPSLMAQLRSQAAAVQGGSLAHVEAILINQATALQSLFARLSERGMGSDSLSIFEGNMRIALRAQSQCRATLETLAAIKNPPIVYARQANIAQGPQQVNNGVNPPSRARENEIEQNKLLETRNDECLDTGAAGLASRGDPALETVGAFDGTENSQG